MKRFIAYFLFLLISKIDERSKTLQDDIAMTIIIIELLDSKLFSKYEE